MTQTQEQKAVVREGLCREVAFELRADGDDALDGNTLVGYGAVFGSTVLIDSWEGCFNETINRGAFKKSLSERTPVMQFDHGHHPMVGSIPIGSFDQLREDDNGLYVQAPLHDNWLVQPVRDAIKSGSIPGMSFRFSVVKEEWRTAAGELLTEQDEISRLLWASSADLPSTILSRSLLELKLYEVGPVVFPAYPETEVGVRSREILTALTDPQVRAAVAAGLVGTPSEPGEAVGASGEGRAAPTDVEPPQALPVTPVPSPEARDRDLRLTGVLT